jgi:lipoate-protein ligase A
LDNYAFVNNRVIWAIEQMIHVPAELLPEEQVALDSHCRSFCMAKPTKYDVMIQGKKVGGAAQRKTRHGFLHQGSISIGFLPESYLSQVLKGGSQVLEGMRQNSFAILDCEWTQSDLAEARKTLQELLQKAFSEEYA